MPDVTLRHSLMVQGTTSDAGKSILTAGLCCVAKRMGVKVAPFKPQNMALNSAVTEDNGEIGRAQAVQALACDIAPTTDMNPILLKPNSDIGAQVIIHGKALASMDAKGFHDYKSVAMDAVMESWQRLQQHYELILVEGAGSPAEINLRDNDIANMGFAEKADCPVIIVADIDRGGVFAHLTGTLNLLSASEQNRVLGFVINRFRGDIALLQSGIDWLEQYTGKPVFGVLPYLHGLHIEAEDAISPENYNQKLDNTLHIAVPITPRISNHTDLDPLRAHPQVTVTFVGPEQNIPPCDLIILPGSKSVRQDLAALRQYQWDDAIAKHLRYGGKVLGICGGFQMLGEHIHDPHAIEGKAGSTEGLGYLAMETVLQENKQLHNVTGVLSENISFSGYEIHAGITSGSALNSPLCYIGEAKRPEGAISEDQQIAGTYIHGIFNHPDACQHLLRWAGLTEAKPYNYEDFHLQQIERLADAIEQHLDINALAKAMATFFNKSVSLRETQLQ